jgi:AraC-like DNA-binding protein
MNIVRVCTNEWPEQDRLSIFRERVGGDRVRIEPVAGAQFRIDATFRSLPGLRLVSVRRSALRSDFREGCNDRLMINLGGPALAEQSGEELTLAGGEAVLLSGADGGSFTTMNAGRIATIEFVGGVLAKFLREPETSRAWRLPAKLPALLLLRQYVNAICANGASESASLGRLAATHIQDLTALALGASREAEQTAIGRGVRAARLAAIKAHILSQLDSDLALQEVAARHGVSARYIRMLFEAEGTSFSEFVRDERLKHARSMLLSPRFSHLRISEIAYHVGFNDLSYFNRSFRQRFGLTPSELRHSNPPDL